MISKAKLDRYLEKVENDPGLIGEAAGLKRSLSQDAVWMRFFRAFLKSMTSVFGWVFEPRNKITICLCAPDHV